MDKRWQALAAAERECPDCKGAGVDYIRTGPDSVENTPCMKCAGTGKVPVLPLLRDVCEAVPFLDALEKPRFHHRSNDHPVHYAEGCPGYVVKPPDLALLITALRAGGYEPALATDGAWLIEKKRQGWFWSETGTDLERLSEAACAALGVDAAAE